MEIIFGMPAGRVCYRPWWQLGNRPAGRRYPRPEATAPVGSARRLVNLIECNDDDNNKHHRRLQCVSQIPIS
jgi:hypothetical protein